MADKSVAVVMVGGPTTDTRFRPLTLNVPKPLFPLAGKPMVHHPILACKKIPNLTHVFLIGFFDEKEFAVYISSLADELRVPVRYLKEDMSHGSAGGLHHFKNVLLEDDPSNIFVLNCDVCSTFPLDSLLEAHKKNGGMATILTKKVESDIASEFGELVSDPETSEILHYAERPETFVSDRINCGVYIFSPEIFGAIKDAIDSQAKQSGAAVSQSTTKARDDSFVRLDQDVFSPYAGKKKLYAYESPDFWEQIKNPGYALKSSALYLSHYRSTAPDTLASEGEGKPAIKGDVYVHFSTKVHPTAKLGPNVSVSPNCRIGPGVRLKNCIVLDGTEIKENSIVESAIIGWKSVIGRWARVQGSGKLDAKLGTTILGEDVNVKDEVVVINCISLPHKSLSSSVMEEIIL